MKPMFKYATMTSALMLAACGGPDSTNRVPTVSGELTQTFKTEAESQFSLSLQDADGDSLTLSLTEQPDWLSLDVSNNQATFTVNPRFYNIGEHEIELSLFDGTDLITRTLSLKVEDNPEAHQEVTLNADELAGSWVFNNGYQLHLYGDSRGLWKTPENNFFPINWNISEDAQSLSLTVHLPSCVERCDPIENIELNMVFSEGEHARIGVLKEDESTAFANATKQSDSAMPVGNYYQLGALANGRMAHFDSESNNVSFNARIANDSFESFAFVFADTQIDAEYQSNDDNTASTFTTSAELFNDSGVSFIDTEDGLETTFAFNFSAESIDVRFSDEHLSIIEVGIKQTLLADLTNEEIERFQGLQAYLDQDITVWIEYVPLQDAALTLEAGKHYASTFPFSNLDSIEQGEAEFHNHTTLSIIDETQATLSTLLSNDVPLANQEVTYSIEGNQLTIEHGDTPMIYSFFETPNGQVLSSIQGENGELSAMNVFIEKPEMMTDVLSGKHLFNVSSSAFHEKSVSSARTLALNPDETHLPRIDGVLTLTQAGENGALHTISASEPSCDIEMSIDDCRALQDTFAMEDSEYLFQEHVLEPLAVSEGRYYLNLNTQINASGHHFSLSFVREYIDPEAFASRFSTF